MRLPRRRNTDEPFSGFVVEFEPGRASTLAEWLTIGHDDSDGQLYAAQQALSWVSDPTAFAAPSATIEWRFSSIAYGHSGKLSRLFG